jgi:hypothetical protein
MQGIQTADQIGYWRQTEAAGAAAIDLSPQANDGAYTGVTLGETGIGDGETCPLFDGANDFNEIQSVGFAADWDGNEFTIAGWLKVSAGGIWIDGLQHNAITISKDGNNQLYICAAVGNNTMGIRFVSGGVDKTSHLAGITSTGWLHVGLTVSETDDEKKTYLNGLIKATENGLGSWVGDTALAIIGAANDTPAECWDGWLAHWIILKQAISAAEMLQMATV